MIIADILIELLWSPATGHSAPAAIRASNVVLLIPPPVNKRISVAERVGVVLKDGVPVTGVVARSEAKSKEELLTPDVRKCSLNYRVYTGN